jgi:hypothetical protein
MGGTSIHPAVSRRRLGCSGFASRSVLKRASTVVALTACTVLTSVSGPIVAPGTAQAAPKVYTIMPLGDSITRGGGQTVGEYIGYRGPLQAYLKALPASPYRLHQAFVCQYNFTGGKKVCATRTVNG